MIDRYRWILLFLLILQSIRPFQIKINDRKVGNTRYLPSSCSFFGLSCVRDERISNKCYSPKKEQIASFYFPLMEYVEMEKEGYLNKPTELDFKDGWKSKVSITCKNNHVWSTSLYNLLKLRTWCPQCARLLDAMDYQQTAEWFNGTFLGFVSVSSRKSLPVSSRRIFLKSSYSSSFSSSSSKLKPLWQCSEGHQFTQILKNIRLNPLGKRKCSWCPTCRRLYKIEFLWNPDLNKRSLPVEFISPLPLPPPTAMLSLPINSKLQRRREQLIDYIRQRNGTIHSFHDLLFPRQWKSKILVSCQFNHTWNASIKSLLYNQRWCARCAARLDPETFHLTAKRFQGQFLGLVEKNTSRTNTSLSYQLARWRCQEGHDFLQKIANIRNRRSCSWCPRCSQAQGLRFRWEGD